MIKIERLFKSFKWAWHGLRDSFYREQNLRIELIVFLFVVIVGFFFKLSKAEWIAVINACFFVVFAEMINTCIERITDLITDKRKLGFAKQAKDVGAAAVLISAIYSLFIAIMIFLPKLKLIL